MRDEGVIHVAGHPLLNRRCTRLPGCMRLRNDLYCVEWGVKLYSLTHSLVRIGTAHARLLKTSIQVSKYLIPSLNGERFERSPGLFGTDLRYLSNTSCDEENEFFGVCVEYTHLVWLEILSLRVRTNRCNVSSCQRHRNYRAHSERSTPSSEVHPSALGGKGG